MEVLSVLFWYSLVANVSFFEALLLLNVKAGKYYARLFLPQISSTLWFAVVMWAILWLLQATACFLYLRHLGEQWTTAITLVVVALPCAMLALPAFFRMRIATLSLTLLIAALGLDIAACVLFFKVHLVSGWLILPTTVWLGYLIVWVAYVKATQSPKNTKVVQQQHRSDSTSRGYTNSAREFQIV